FSLVKMAVLRFPAQPFDVCLRRISLQQCMIDVFTAFHIHDLTLHGEAYHSFRWPAIIDAAIRTLLRNAAASAQATGSSMCETHCQAAGRTSARRSSDSRTAAPAHRPGS